MNIHICARDEYCKAAGSPHRVYIRTKRGRFLGIALNRQDKFVQSKWDGHQVVHARSTWFDWRGRK